MTRDYDAIHDAVSDDPESVWDRLCQYLCRGLPPDELGERELLNKTDLVEDLMHRHADEFIERLEALADECASAREAIATAHVGGTQVTPALERFYALQERCAHQDPPFLYHDFGVPHDQQ